MSSNAVKEGVNHSIAAVSQIRAAEKKKADEDAAAIAAMQEALKLEEEQRVNEPSDVPVGQEEGGE